VLLSCQKDVGQNTGIKITNTSFENVPQFKYLRMAAANKNLIQEKIKRRMVSRNP
jgi:hypothetical protein